MAPRLSTSVSHLSSETRKKRHASNNDTRARFSCAEQLHPDEAEGFVNWKSASAGGIIMRM